MTHLIAENFKYSECEILHNPTYNDLARPWFSVPGKTLSLNSLVIPGHVNLHKLKNLARGPLENR